ncbi:hypothetical protein TSUD_204390 [Trifolium subterraneum]|uniref:SRP54-type proteins GTP-binding domain-containing protein n=1 Tax=Trifolium subterraneum TaxID=3900 RepID=A0A2Z6PGT1_TRISU|nr:hypothetical protein TSUD_204390 [Trifolium subterraneum]
MTAATAGDGEATVTTNMVREEKEADRENKMKSETGCIFESSPSPKLLDVSSPVKYCWERIPPQPKPPDPPNLLKPPNTDSELPESTNTGLCTTISLTLQPPDTGLLPSTAPSRRGPPPEPPDTSFPRFWTTNISTTEEDSTLDESRDVHIVEGGKDLEKLRVKWVIYVWDISLNLMGQMHKSVPFILHSNSGVHVSPSGQHTSSLLSYMSPNGHNLASDLYHVNTIAIHVFPLIGGLVISFILVGQIQLSLNGEVTRGHSTCVLGVMIQNSIGEYDVLRATPVLACYKQSTAFYDVLRATPVLACYKQSIVFRWMEGKLFYLSYGLESLLTMVKDVKVLDVLKMSTYAIAKWPYKDVNVLNMLQMLTCTIAKWIRHSLFPPLQGNYQLQYEQGVDEYSGKKKCASIFISNHYVGTLKDIHYTKELSKYVSMRVGNSSNLIKIGCWLKQHNNPVILSTCDAIQMLAIKQLGTHENKFQRYVLKKGYVKDLDVVTRGALQQTLHNVLDVALVDKHGYNWVSTNICEKAHNSNYGQQEQRKGHSINTISFAYNHLINEGWSQWLYHAS